MAAAAAASCVLSEDQFLCSICQGVFTDPVTIPCGHNFCKTCISENWDINAPCRCPNCQKVFRARPELQVNTFICEMAARFRQSAQHKTRVCEKHKEPLKLFCQTDQTCVCVLCVVKDHNTHKFVSLEEEYEGKKAELGKMEADVQKMIQERRLKVQEMRRSGALGKEGADREIADGDQVFTALKESLERSRREFMETVRERQREAETKVEGFIKELEQEIYDLEKRNTEVKQLSKSEDHLKFLQNFLSLNVAPQTKNWTDVIVHPPSYGGTARAALLQFEEKFCEEMKTFSELKRVQQYAVDLTLDPNTAHPKLNLSEDGKQIKYGDVKKIFPDNPLRFDKCACVLSEQSFSTGRFYCEVEVRGKTKWDFGVATESINRKGDISLRPQNGYWTIWLRKDHEYKANAGPGVLLSLHSRPQKVGLFVDYEERLVSFYDVDTTALIYSFTGCSFTEKLYLYFSPCNNNKKDGGKNSAPLIISPVNHTERHDDHVTPVSNPLRK